VTKILIDALGTAMFVPKAFCFDELFVALS
jgi:hypothetical protein